MALLTVPFYARAQLLQGSSRWLGVGTACGNSRVKTVMQVVAKRTLLCALGLAPRISYNW